MKIRVKSLISVKHSYCFEISENPKIFGRSQEVGFSTATRLKSLWIKRRRVQKQISKIVHNGSCAYLYELCPISRCREHLSSFLDKADHLGALRPEKTPITETYT